MKVTSYTDQYIQDLKQKFLKKFQEDKTPFKQKLDQCHIPKGTYSSLMNGKHKPNKRVLEAMRAYLEGRPPKFTLVKEGEFYCSSCESILAESEQYDSWTCKPCHSEIAYKSKVKHRSYAREIKRSWYRRILLVPGVNRTNHLAQRSDIHLIKTWGPFAGSIKLIRQIKKAVNDYERSQENGSERR